MTSLADKTILVTGGSRGIGAAMCRALTQAGARVVMHYGSNEAAARDLQAEIGEERCITVQADFADPAAPEQLWEAARAQVGAIDVLINNAAVYQPAPIDDPLEQWKATWDRVIRINLLAAADLCRCAIADFRDAGGGKIINVSSRAAFRGETGNQMPYGASKGGLITLTRTIAREFAADGILAFAIAPGFVGTDMVWEILSEADLAAVRADIPLGEIAPPEEIAALAVFLCSDAVRHMTGATFDVNGASFTR